LGAAVRIRIYVERGCWKMLEISGAKAARIERLYFVE
jgi:hypothetical protein